VSCARADACARGNASDRSGVNVSVTWGRWTLSRGVRLTDANVHEADLDSVCHGRHGLVQTGTLDTLVTRGVCEPTPSRLQACSKQAANRQQTGSKQAQAWRNGAWASLLSVARALTLEGGVVVARLPPQVDISRPFGGVV